MNTALINSLEVLSLPLEAENTCIKDASGVTVARGMHPFVAAALVELANLGVDKYKKVFKKEMLNRLRQQRRRVGQDLADDLEALGTLDHLRREAKLASVGGKTGTAYEGQVRVNYYPGCDRWAYFGPSGVVSRAHAQRILLGRVTTT